MNSLKFNFFIPVDISFRRGLLSDIDAKIPVEFRKIAIITDTGSFSHSGADGIIKNHLNERSILIYDQIEENPPFENVHMASEFCSGFEPDLIIGIGGGSAMDAAKGVAVLLVNDGSLADFVFGKKSLSRSPLPVCSIPTTSGTGSEVTPFAVFSDKSGENKCGYSHPGIFSRMALIDPALTDSLPEIVRINSGLDVLTHAIEAYFSTESNPINDHIALQAVDLVLNNLDRAVELHTDAIDTMSYASMLAGVAISHASTILLHIMAYPLTVHYNIPHGRANAALLPAFLDFMRDHSTIPDKISVILDKFIPFGGVVSFLSNLGVNTDLNSYGIKRSDISNFSQKTILKDDVKITPARLSTEIIENIYYNAL